MLLQNIYIPVESNSSFDKGHAILVISPHPDDDVIGMGGKMALMARKEKVFSLYITDGSGSLRKESRENIPFQRKQEALNALSIVKAQGAFFLNAKSSCLKERGPEYQKILHSIQNIIKFLEPKEIYITAPWEIHPTHLACSQILLDSLEERKIPIYGYPVWGPLLGKEILSTDITEVVEIKKKAIQAHKGEILYKAYDEGVLARNFYQAVYENPHNVSQAKYIELFLDMSDIKTNMKQYALEKAISYIDSLNMEKIYP